MPKTKSQQKHEIRAETSETSENEIPVAQETSSESESESEVELSEDSESENEAELKGLEDTNKHIIIKPSKHIDNSKTKSKTGVIYLGRLPEQFQEAEMEKYFKQFGEITRVKLSRNKKTGKSKHYGFIEFENIGVAKVASEAMNNYLLYGHLLKCLVVENPNEEIFNQGKFKIIPWKSISRNRNDKPKSEKHWEKLSKNFEGSKKRREEKLRGKGIDISYLE